MRRGISESGNGPAPVIPICERSAFLARDIEAVTAQTITAVALHHRAMELRQLEHLDWSGRYHELHQLRQTSRYASSIARVMVGTSMSGDARICWRRVCRSSRRRDSFSANPVATLTYSSVVC